MIRAYFRGLVLASMTTSAPIVGTVSAVTDGDTLTVAGIKIRLCGVDAPEIKTPAGIAAREELVRLALGQTASCITVGNGTPCDGRSKSKSYERVVATCTVAGSDLAASMVRAGKACDWKRYSDGFYGGLNASPPCSSQRRN